MGKRKIIILHVLQTGTGLLAASIGEQLSVRYFHKQKIIGLMIVLNNSKCFAPL